MNLGLYLHIPFCEHKCGYCDFYSAANIDHYGHTFVNALVKEIERTENTSATCDTIFFGGGTPSLLSTSQLEKILNALHKHFSILPNTELTIETNPETVNLEKLKSFKSLGFNRISFGVQSFIDHELKFMERIHSADKAKEAITNARVAGFSNISLDLIFALPDQTLDDWKYTLDQAITLNTDHISAYSLIFEKNTRFGQLVREQQITPKEQEEDRKFYEFTIQYLAKHGFTQYETSNYATSESKQSKHNLKYWEMAPYLGFGPSAHSFDGIRTRHWNIRSTEKYIEKIESNTSAIINSELLSGEDHMFEWIMLGFRMKKGIDLAHFNRRFGCSFAEKYSESIIKFQDMGLIELTETHCKLTDEGVFYSDQISTYF